MYLESPHFYLPTKTNKKSLLAHPMSGKIPGGQNLIPLRRPPPKAIGETSDWVLRLPYSRMISHLWGPPNFLVEILGWDPPRFRQRKKKNLERFDWRSTSLLVGGFKPPNFPKTLGSNFGSFPPSKDRGENKNKCLTPGTQSLVKNISVSEDWGWWRLMTTDTGYLLFLCFFFGTEWWDDSSCHVM